MTFFQKILFPFDFSGAGTAMASPVVAMAQRLNARVTVLNAFHLAPDYVVAPRFADTKVAEPTVIPYTPVFEELRHAQERRLKEFVRAQFIGVDSEARIEDGEAAMAIEWVAKHEHSDLIMMPTRGLGKFRRLLLGSVTAKVLHDVECPVFPSSHEADAKSSSSGGYQTLLCAVRFASESEEALRIAVALAQAWRARVCILHIGPQSGAQETEAAVASIRHGFQQSGNDAADSGVDCHVRVLGGSVSEGIQQAAIDEEADLIVMGRGHFRSDIARLWSHACTIIREFPCPVLSV